MPAARSGAAAGFFCAIRTAPTQGESRLRIVTTATDRRRASGFRMGIVTCGCGSTADATERDASASRLRLEVVEFFGGRSLLNLMSLHHFGGAPKRSGELSL